MYYFNLFVILTLRQNEISASSRSPATHWKRVPGEGVLWAQKWWICEADGGVEFVGTGSRQCQYDETHMPGLKYIQSWGKTFIPISSWFSLLAIILLPIIITNINNNFLLFSFGGWLQQKNDGTRVEADDVKDLLLELTRNPWRMETNINNALESMADSK